MLFARLDEGRMSLVRFGPLVQFDTLGPSPQAVEKREAPAVSLSRPVIAEAVVVVAETQRDLGDADELDNIETAAFSRAMVVRASRRGMLPRRG